MLAVHLPESAILLLFLPLFASCLYVFYCFDSLLRYQHQHHFEEWVKDGKPIGIFWVPPGASLFRGSLARNYACVALLICSKPWIEFDEDAKRLRRRYQFAQLVYFVIFGLVFWLLFSSMSGAK